MRFTSDDLEILENLSKGKKVAYVDRIRRRFRGVKQFAGKGGHYPLSVSRRMEDVLESEGWRAFYSPKVWLTEFPSMSALMLNTLWGFGSDSIRASTSWVSGLLGLSRPSSQLGLVESIFAGPTRRPHALIRTPTPGGGYALHEFALVAPPELAGHLGQSVEFTPSQKKKRARIKPISPPSVVHEGRISHLSAFELILVMESHAEKMTFAGAWKREMLPEVYIGKKCLPEELAGLYVHRETGEGILVFRGTRPMNPQDWIVNIRTSHGMETSHHRQATATTRAATKICPHLLVVGHSKGGGLAQYVSAKMGLPCATFNTVGLPENLTPPPHPSSPLVEHFMIKYDPVSNVGGSPERNSQGILGPLASIRGVSQPIAGENSIVHVLPPPAHRGRVLALHSLSSFKEVLRENPMMIPTPTRPHRSPSFGVKGVVICPDTAEMIYEIKEPYLEDSGKSTCTTLQRKPPALSRCKITPSSISATNMSKLL